MAQAIQKIALSASRDIPFNKLVLSQSNVRRLKAGVSIEELAEDIARRTLLQSLTVRPVLDEAGAETGIFEIPAGGRRYRALELLVKQKRLTKTTPIPCVVRTEGLAEEDSLAENVQRAPLHPLDQFRAFLTLREKGQSEEEIAAAFFVSVAVVKQRLRLASVSNKLLDAYGEDQMTLDQLMAFTVSADHERQEQVRERLQSAYSKEPSIIRRLLTEGAVKASDKRARFIGDAYEAAGGLIMRDLFQGDDGGWLQDSGLVNRLVAERLERESAAVRAEGWKWIEVEPDFPYGHTFGLRQLRGIETPITAEEEARRDALQAEYDQLEESYADAEEVPEDIERRFQELESELGTLAQRPVAFAPDDVGRAGAFVSIDSTGGIRVERGYVRPKDEVPVAPQQVSSHGEVDVLLADEDATDALPHEDEATGVAPAAEALEEHVGMRPIPDRLMSELTAHRTLALRQAIGENAEIAFIAALHALCLKLFYTYPLDTCLELDVKRLGFGAQAPGLGDTNCAKHVDARHESWANALPEETADLWDALLIMDGFARSLLFAHCVSLSVNAVFEAYNRRPRALAHADRLAQALDLDMAAAGWKPTVDNYFGRVTKTRIFGAVREAKGDQAANLIDHFKKPEMAAKAETLLDGSGWLPEPLRTPGRPMTTVEAETDGSDPMPDAATVAESESDGQNSAVGEIADFAEDARAESDAQPMAAD